MTRSGASGDQEPETTGWMLEKRIHEALERAHWYAGTTRSKEDLVKDLIKNDDDMVDMLPTEVLPCVVTWLAQKKKSLRVLTSSMI